jgi:poly(3-hydroxybutyrate) depolymerase
MFYQFYELSHAAARPLRTLAATTGLLYSNPLNPFSQTPPARSIWALCDLFERVTRRYDKPAFGIKNVIIEGESVEISEKVVWSRPFCNLLYFERGIAPNTRTDPKILIVAPMSGHHASLLRGTVEALLAHSDVYITDWVDARIVPVVDGQFDLDDYIDYLIDMFHFLGADTHVMAVCQPAVPVLAAIALMEARNDQLTPSSMTLMSGPIDTRINPTEVNCMAQDRDIKWFSDNVIMPVPFPARGFMRSVYPGFLQLGAFVSMNADRHVNAHNEYFSSLIKGDDDSVEKHRAFYDEYLAVMDLTAEFYLQTVETVFINHALPKGEMMHRNEAVDPSCIRNTALFTIEGENDDISSPGQTEAAHRLCSNLPAIKHAHYVQPGAGHYGVFSGSRFRAEVTPKIIKFIQSNRHIMQAPNVQP